MEVQAMRCKACDGELILMNVVRDAVPGFEHHSFVCSECHITERRALFTRHGREDDNIAPMLIHAAPPTVPELTDEDGADTGFFSRVIARICGR
jgi:hypothetical protein